MVFSFFTVVRPDLGACQLHNYIVKAKRRQAILQGFSYFRKDFYKKRGVFTNFFQGSIPAIPHSHGQHQILVNAIFLIFERLLHISVVFHAV